MKRRTVLRGTGTVLSGIGLTSLAGCTAEPGCDTENNFNMPSGLPAELNETQYTPNPYSDCAVYAEDDGIYLTDVKISDEGERDCYHTVEGTVINGNDEPVSPTLNIQFYSGNGQVEMTFTKQFLELGPGATTDLRHEQQMPCFNSYDLTGYTIDATY